MRPLLRGGEPSLQARMRRALCCGRAFRAQPVGQSVAEVMSGAAALGVRCSARARRGAELECGVLSGT